MLVLSKEPANCHWPYLRKSSDVAEASPESLLKLIGITFIYFGPPDALGVHYPACITPLGVTWVRPSGFHWTIPKPVMGNGHSDAGMKLKWVAAS